MLRLFVQCPLYMTLSLKSETLKATVLMVGSKEEVAQQSFSTDS